MLLFNAGIIKSVHNFLGSATDAFAWANYSSGSCHPCARMGPLQYTGGAANAFAWAHYYSEDCCQCAGMGPFQNSGPAAKSFTWAHYFLGAPDVLGWAHCNIQVQLPMGLPGPITFWELLLMR